MKSSDTLDAHTTIAPQPHFGCKKITAFPTHSAAIQESVSAPGNFLHGLEKKKKLA
jgi:hypothetical protein